MVFNRFFYSQEEIFYHHNSKDIAGEDLNLGNHLQLENLPMFISVSVLLQASTVISQEGLCSVPASVGPVQPLWRRWHGGRERA